MAYLIFLGRASLKTLVITSLILSFSSCSTTIIKHPWQSEEKSHTVFQKTQDWSIVKQHLYVAVPENTVREAQKLLSSKEYLLLNSSQESTFNQHLSTPENSNLRPYLIRAVSLGVPTYSFLKTSTDNQVLTYRARWNGEMLIPFSKAEVGVWPIVLYLEKEPSKIIALADYGGDWIFYRPETKDYRLSERKQKEGLK